MEENQVIENSVNNPIVEPENEKMVPQSHVNKLIKQKTYEAAQSKRELEEKHQRELEAIQAHQTQRNENVPRDIDVDAIYQQVQERFNQEMQKRHFTEETNKVVQSYLSKMEEGKKTYDDFDSVTEGFDPTAFPQLTWLVSGMDNAADIIYHLGDPENAVKLDALDSLAIKNPKQAQAALVKLSNSLTTNRKALAEENSNTVAAPLDRLQSSRVSGSNGKMGIRDLRNQPWLKG